MTASQPFSLGVTYWPRRAGYRWWSLFDRGELREDVQHIAALGLKAARICLPWEEIQPAPRRVSSALLRLLEQTLDVFGDARIDVTVALFPVALGGSLFAPRWIANPDPLNDLMRIGALGTVIDQFDLPDIVYEGRARPSNARDLFRDTSVIEAQRFQIEEVVGYFGSHPAIRLWQLGQGLELAHSPGSDEAVAEWYAQMSDAVRSAYTRARTVGVISPFALLGRAGPRPDHVAEGCDLAAIALDTPLPLPEFLLEQPDALEFLYLLACGLAGKPLGVWELGMPTAVGGRPHMAASTFYGQAGATALLSGQDQSERLYRTLERLQRLGAPQVMLADLNDYGPDLWREPPFATNSRSRSLGLLDTAGREKPASAAIQSFRPAEAAASEPTRMEIDPERYWHNPGGECLRLWREFQLER